MELDEALELAGLIPRDCQVTVKHNARGYPTVVDVLPALQTKPHATPQPVASPTPKPPEPDDIPF
jgi:hypothetical protein